MESPLWFHGMAYIMYLSLSLGGGGVGGGGGGEIPKILELNIVMSWR